MKKLLALVLALVMSMSLVTISNAAFKDADEISNKEAVEVMNLVGVIAGYDNGNFGAKDTLTRAQAAKIVAYLDLGKATADAIVGTGKVFSDVKATAWYAGFVEYCAGAGYVAGIGDGKFAPDEKVTGVQFAKMLLCALGYKAEVEGYTGGDYTINIARDANKNDLYKDTNATAIGALTREQAAQMAFNTLKATVVEYQGGTNVSTSDGTKVTVNAVRNEVANTSYDYAARSLAGGTQQLCEKLYGQDLKLHNGDQDDMKRTAHYWSYKGTDSDKYADSADYTEVVAKSGKTVAQYISDVMKKTFDTASADVYVNGVDAAVSSELKVGDKVEFFMNSDNVKKVDNVVITRIKAAVEVNNAVETRTKDNEDQVLVPNVTGSYKKASNVIGYEGIQKGDIVTYYITGTGADTKYFISKTTAVEGKLTEIKSGSPAKLVVGGSDYMINAGLDTPYSAADDSFGATYKYYLDVNGFVVKGEEIEAAKSDFVVLQDIAVANGNGGVGSSEFVNARIVKVDGTASIEKIKSVKVGDTTYKGDTLIVDDGSGVKMVATAVSTLKNAAFFTYTVNSDGEYELTKIATGTDYTANTSFSTSTTDDRITNKGTTFGTSTKYVVSDGTVFIVAKAGSGDDNTKYVVYTGKDNVPTIGTTVSGSCTSSGAVITDKNGVAKFVFVTAYTGTSASSGKTVMFVKDTYESKIIEKINGSDVTYYTYKVIDDTTLTTIKVKADSVTVGQPLTPTYDSNGMFTSGSNAGNYRAATADDSYKLSNGTLVVTGSDGTNAFVCADDVKVFVKNGSDFSETTAGSYSYSNTALKLGVTVVLTNGTDNTVKYVFITETEV